VASPDWNEEEEIPLDVAEAMVSTLALERGGLIRITHDRVESAANILSKMYPNGAHVHFSANEHALQAELMDRSKCERTLNSDKMMGLDSQTYEVTNDGMVAKNPSQMKRADLEAINHAQHILIMALMHRTGQISVEVSRDEFVQIIKGEGGAAMGVPALQISKKGDTVSAARLTGITMGKA